MIVGSDKVYAIENFYAKYLAEAGVVIDRFSSQSFFIDHYNKNLFNKLLYKSGLSGIYRRINRMFLNELDRIKPDIVWIFKGMEISPASLKYVKQKGHFLVNYNPDNPFIFSGKGSGNQYITDSIPLYDLHFTYNLQVQAKMEQDFNAKSVFLPFGYDVSEEVVAASQLQQEIMKICFLGNPDKARAHIINTLANAGLSIDVYGNNWNKFLDHQNITIFPPVYADELWKVLRRYRVQLNMMRMHNENSHNMRTFEIPAIAGIQLAPETSEHRMFFKEGEEIFLYKNADHCVQIAKRLLSLSSSEAGIIRTKARARSVSSGYSYRDRSLQVLNALNGYVNG